MINWTQKKSGQALLCLVLIAVLLVVNVAAARMSSTIALGLGAYLNSTVNEDSDYSVGRNYLDGFEASVNIASEGTVLLKNDGILPLGEGTRVTLLGAGSYNYILGGTGSAGGRDDEYSISMYDAFAEAGLDINDKVWSNLEYACGGARNVKSRYDNYVQGKDADNGWTSYRLVHEFSPETYTQHILNGDAIGKYGEYAIVTISRSGAEGASPSMDYDRDGSTLTGTTYLQLDENEKALLALCAESFEHTIVIVNSSTPMELGFIDSEAYNIDACLWIGHPGEAGLVGVGYVLTGIVSPSGALVDTYAYDLTTNPTYYNTDDNRYANAGGQTFYQYEEGIYVGYRYYETADAEGYFDSDAFKALTFKGADGVNPAHYTGGYDSVVQFPFGYGQSYTAFTQEIASGDIKLDAHGTNSITVRVTNTGAYTGKEIVQLYMDAPYNSDPTLGIQGRGLEKAKVVLIGYDKTKELAPGESQELTIEFETDDLASFDNFGQGCYVLEKGEYSFNIQDNAHDWKDPMGGSFHVSLADTYIYNEAHEGARASDVAAAVNSMDDVTAGDGCMLEGYLSRSDFAAGMAEIMKHQSDETPNENASPAVAAALATGGTDTYEYVFDTYKNGVRTTVTETLYGYANNAATWMDGLPANLSAADVEGIEWEKTYYVVVDSADNAVMTKDSGSGVLDDFDLYESEDAVPKDVLAMGSTVRPATVRDLGSVPAGDVKWDQLTSMITLEEAIKIQGNCGWSTPAVPSVGKDGVTANDGPGEPNNGGSDMVTWFPSATLIAATWNRQLAYDEGVAYGQWCVYLNIGAAYAPAMNIHRSPFGGRNFEYYSEDGYISGQQGGSAVSGIIATGTSVFIKHMALNDGDTNRGGVCTWANEQAIREIYLVPYELSCKVYGADGIMGSLNRIGMSWAHSGMYTTVLRDEWGWNGHLITDGDGSSGARYNNPVFWLAGTQGSMLANGIFVNDETVQSNFGDSAFTSPLGQYLLHQTAKHCLYQYGNSNMTEGYFAYWWVGVLIAVDVVILLGIAAILAKNFVIPAVKSKKTVKEGGKA